MECIKIDKYVLLPNKACARCLNHLAYIYNIHYLSVSLIICRRTVENSSKIVKKSTANAMAGDYYSCY